MPKILIFLEITASLNQSWETEGTMKSNQIMFDYQLGSYLSTNNKKITSMCKCVTYERGVSWKMLIFRGKSLVFRLASVKETKVENEKWIQV